MAINRTRVMLGGVLIIIGLLSLLHNFRLLRLSEEYVVSLIFSGSGVALFHHGRSSARKWACYWGGALLVVGVIIFIAATPFLPDELIGTLWLWLLAGVLYGVYQRNHDRWWVLLFALPAFTIGGVVLLEGFRLLRGDIAAILINLGLAGTFAFLYAIRSPERKLGWAKYPAAVFTLVAAIIFLAENYGDALPLAISGMLILGGLYLIFRTLRTDLSSANPDQQNSTVNI
jgi:uncharacterized membrane protein HdeD (DUF308 family)